MSARRYPAYKPSGVEWLGEVPTHWEVLPLKHLAEIENGRDHKDIEVEEGHPVYGSGGQFAFASSYLYDGESVLLGRKGTIDRPLYVSGRFWTVDTMYWTCVRPTASARFLYYSALNIPFSYYSTNTALPSMTKSVLAANPLCVPPLAEQEAIAAFLDAETAKIDALVAEQDRLVGLLREKRQAVISHAVTRGLNPAVPMKPSGVEWLGEVPAHWEVVPLKRWLLRNDGGVWGNDPIGIDDTLVLRSTEQTVNGDWAIDDPAYRQLSPQDRASAMLVAGDLLLTKSSGSSLHIGKTTIVTEEVARLSCCYSNFMQRLRVTSVNSPRLAWYLLNSKVCRQQFDYHSNSTTGLANLNGSIINKIMAAQPPLSEQEAIATFLDAETARIDALIAEADKGSALLKERRAALIAAAVTGQLDLRGGA
jgi:type I restriction enzyme S subunit